ncbi:DUF305 domain-containing protein [Salinispora arenicola]|uniref:DUF305 domain-containing protein n=1 Tax=Salinispora arenicola TaxID=168697 RepID=UPI0039AF6DFB
MDHFPGTPSQGLELVGLAGARAQQEEIKTLAAAVEATQDDEVTMMRPWLGTWSSRQRSTTPRPRMLNTAGCRPRARTVARPQRLTGDRRRPKFHQPLRRPPAQCGRDVPVGGGKGGAP